jgi:hypothetical protein
MDEYGAEDWGDSNQTFSRTQEEILIENTYYEAVDLENEYPTAALAKYDSVILLYIGQSCDLCKNMLTFLYICVGKN